MDTNELNRRFDYKRPDESTQDVHVRLRAAVKGLAEFLDELLPPGRESALAITNLEQAQMWGHAAIARA